MNNGYETGIKRGMVAARGGDRSAAQAGISGTRDRLGAVGDGELGEDARDVVADGFLADVEPGGDRLVRMPARDQVEDLVLAIGQLRKHGDGAGRPGAGEELDDTLRN